MRLKLHVIIFVILQSGILNFKVVKENCEHLNIEHSTKTFESLNIIFERKAENNLHKELSTTHSKNNTPNSR